MTESNPAQGQLRERERTLVETNGIDIIAESERTAKPSDLFWPWFAANVSVFGMSYAAFVYGFGVSFAQAILVTVVGVTLSFLFCGIIAIAGKRGSAPTMVLSRAAFGVNGQKVPGVFSWLISIGWETFLAIMATLATATVFGELGWSSGTTTKVIACVVIAALIVLASVAGYHTIIAMQSVLTWLTGAITILYIVLTFGEIDMSVVTALPGGSTQAVIGALVMVMTGFGLGWINIAADWSRYQRRDASGGAIVFWNTFGGALAPTLLVCYGLALAGTQPGLIDGIANDPIGTLATILPNWFLVPFLVAAVLALVSGAVLGIYSSGLTLLSLGVKIPRPAAAGIDGIILTLGTIYVVFFAENFLAPFQSFLITLGVPIATWAGILMADVMLRRRDYDEHALFHGSGRYGDWNWTSVALMAVGSVVGWGLVINSFAEDAGWNNWQGYLLGPLGLGGRDGDWAWANLGVFVALLIGFVGYAVLQAGAVRRQEAAAPVAPGGGAGDGADRTAV
ncbi:purine-cytosine permease family protein [Ornithinicoccus hortensis]|uniref:Purine-cytosine permease-like protein n=1 Tax=Ornithinicoccus hortensis TaxID=82346 RepID=A0A542YNZ0_9MICO|nr:cytosine permease [Ornithinicoccus hortensis]TQL49767.1 purine-cytosine permease-like protein [Ornithinicoccus hortensis]